MPEAAPRFTVRSLEPEVRRLWATRRLPPRGGVLGTSDGPILRQFEGTFRSGDPPEQVAHRAVAADVDARHLALSGRGVLGTLRPELRRGDADPARLEPLLESLGIWTGGSGEHPWDAADRQPGIQAIVARLARRGILAARDGPLRVCLSCRVPRSPERIIYQKEIGDAFLVRFPIQGTEPTVDALVWVDAPWRLLGASALLVHPDIPYAVVEYRRQGSNALLLTSHGALARLHAWLPDAELEVREERPGREWVGRAYDYPLRHEFPIGGSLDPPAGTIQADAEVGDSGTGIVPLVPGHGPTDAEIAHRLGIAGWPLLTPRGMLDPTLMHKYAGLDVETASEFVARDLSESSAVLARLRVVRGVPYCAVCGHRMVWTPGRAWCLEPGRLPPEQRDRYVRLLPHDPPIGQIEISRWPVSETSTTTDADGISLLECSRCERLDGPEGPRQCPCGGMRRLVARRLLPSVGGVLGAWARCDPMPPTDGIRVYANERRRVPALVHHLAAMTGIDASSSEFGLTLVPTVNRVDVAGLLEKYGADAVRAAFVRTDGSAGTTATFEERCRQEEARLERFYGRVRDLLAQCPPEVIREGAQPPDAGARDLEVEDRAVLARWARAHLQILAAYDRGQAAAAHRHLFRFLERDLLEYLEIVRPRIAPAATPPTRRAALRTLVYLFRAAAISLAPIAPFTAESVHGRLSIEPRSLFESLDLGADRTLVDDDLAAAWDRWHAVLTAADGFRRARGIPPQTALPLAALVLPDEAVAGRLRGERATLERFARISSLEVSSPQVPWEARLRRLVPVDTEILRAYPAQTSQIVHILERMPPRRTADFTAKDLTVFINGVPRTITPEMVKAVDTLPEGFAPTPFALGEMYVQVPGKGDGTPAPPPLSPDAFWLLRRVRRRLAAAPPPTGEDRRVAIVAAVDPLAAELREKATQIAEYLGIVELRIVEAAPEAMPHARITGRTRTGARWSVSLPGVPSRRRAVKQRPARSDGRRVRPPTDATASPEIDYSDEQVIAREQSIRDLGHDLDELIAIPVLGPSKVGIAWEAGLRSVAEFRDAPFDKVAGLAGYGRPVAATLWTKLGRPVPPGSYLRLRTASDTGTPGPPPSVPPPRAVPAVPTPASPPTLPGPIEPLPAEDRRDASTRAPAPEPPSPPVPELDARGPPEAPTPLVEPEAFAAEPLPAPVEPEPPPPPPAPEIAEPPLPEDRATGAPLALPIVEVLEPAREPEDSLDEGQEPPSTELPAEGAAAPPGPVDELGAADLEQVPERPSLAESDDASEAPGVDGEEPTSEEPLAHGLDEPNGGPPESVGTPEEPSPASAEPPVTPESTTVLPELPQEEVAPPSPVDAADSRVALLPSAPPMVLPAPEEPSGTPAEAVDVPPSVPEVGEPGPPTDGEVGLPEARPAAPDAEAAIRPEPSAPTEPIPVERPEGPTPPGSAPARGIPGTTDTAPPAPPPSAGTPPEEPPPPPPSGIEVDFSTTLFPALLPFLDATAAGHKGVALVRELPERIRAHVGPRPVEVYWLTNLERPRALRPTDLAALAQRVQRALDDEGVTAFFVEGIEYLVRIHGVDRVAAFLHDLDEAARAHVARIWLHVTPGLLAEPDVQRLLASLPGRSPAGAEGG